MYLNVNYFITLSSYIVRTQKAHKQLGIENNSLRSSYGHQDNILMYKKENPLNKTISTFIIIYKCRKRKKNSDVH